jgi:hypothetical protein
MIEVHPPEEKIHGVRDFLLHLFTITVGLLIALGLEAGVESWHHHHLQEEANINLRQEIRDNQKQLAASHAAITHEKDNLTKVLAFLDALAAGKPYDIHSIMLDYRMPALSDASWKTASATGVLSYMNYDRAQQYATTYRLQDEVMQLQKETLGQYLRLQSYVIAGFDPDKFSQAQAQVAGVDVRQTLAYLVAMDQIGEGLEKQYEDALKTK